MTETCGIWLKKCREEARKTQEETAEFLDMGLRTYQYCEASERFLSEEKLEKAEEFFGKRNFAMEYIQFKNPFWKKKFKEAAAAITALQKIQSELAGVLPQLLALSDIAQSSFC